MMEITYTQQKAYSLDLDKRMERELADHLDITVRQMKKMIDDGSLMDEHWDAVHAWVGKNTDKATVTDREDIEIDEVTS